MHRQCKSDATLRQCDAKAMQKRCKCGANAMQRRCKGDEIAMQYFVHANTRAVDNQTNINIVQNEATESYPNDPR
jgi:hypothetical protein